MDDRDRELFARFEKNDELIVQFQRGMLAGDQAQARELDELRKSIEMRQLEVPTASAATKAKAIGTGLASLIIALIAAAIQNGWLAEPKAKDPGELPIPASTYR